MEQLMIMCTVKKIANIEDELCVSWRLRLIFLNLLYQLLLMIKFGWTF